MAQTEGGNNVAIIALIVIGLLVAGAVFMYYQGGFTGGSDGSDTTVFERNTVIERDAPAPAADPAPAAKEEGPGFSMSHESEDGKQTTIETN